MQLLLRFLSFYVSAMCSITTSNNDIVAFCAKLAERSNSIVAKNRRHLLSYLQQDELHVKALCLLRKTILNNSSDTTIVQATGNTIHELCMVRDNQLLLELEGGDVSDLIEYLCVN